MEIKMQDNMRSGLHGEYCDNDYAADSHNTGHND
jgi:hypothetical protein